jgi:hypothetical protein
MSAGTLISIIVAVVGCVLAIFFYMNDSLDKRIDKAVNHPDFLKKVADESRLPFLIFDENGTFQTESGGATAYIDKIEPFKEEQRFSGFIIYPKTFLKNAPILHTINNDIFFAKPKRINTIDLKYRIPEFQGTVFANAGQYDEPPAKLFKPEIIRE